MENNLNSSEVHKIHHAGRYIRSWCHPRALLLLLVLLLLLLHGVALPAEGLHGVDPAQIVTRPCGVASTDLLESH